MGGGKQVPLTHLAPRGADSQQDATSCPDHSLEVLVIIGETEAKSEGADDIGGGLGQQQGGVKRLSWGRGAGRRVGTETEWTHLIGTRCDQKETETDRDRETRRKT